MTEPTQIRVHVLISGYVQGVAFRWNTRHKAQELGLSGWVKNLWDGRVEAVFEGPETAVHEAVAWCRHGERPARVENIEIKYSEATGEFKNFRVTY